MRDMHDRGGVIDVESILQLGQQPAHGGFEGLAHALEEAVVATRVEFAQAPQGLGVKDVVRVGGAGKGHLGIEGEVRGRWCCRCRDEGLEKRKKS